MPGIPPYVPVPPVAPIVNPEPNPNINPQPWPYPGWEPWPRDTGTHGHEPYIRYGIGKNKQRNPIRAPAPVPGPGEAPLPKEKKSPFYTPVYITVEVDPEGLEALPYELAITVESEYTRVKKVIKSHKKEVIIIVAIGAIITFGYALLAGGFEVAGGTEILVTPAGQAMYALSGLMLPNAVIKYIQDRYYKHLVIKELKNLRLWAFNMTRKWQCYKEVTTAGNTVYYDFYEGPSKSNKGNLAGIVEVTADFEHDTANIDWYCVGGKDEVWLWNDKTLLQICNPHNEDKAPVALYNITKGWWGEAHTHRSGNTVRYAWEDRPVWGDGDYNDAYTYVTYDNYGNIVSVEAREGSHCDELALYFNWQMIAHFPKRC